ALSEWPDFPKALQNKADALLERGESGTALACYERAIKAGVKKPEVLNQAAWLHVMVGDDADRAVRLARRAVKAAGTEAAFWNTLGAALFRAGEWQEALGPLEQARELSGGVNPYCLLFLAMANAKVGDTAAARGWYDQAITWLNGTEPVDPDLQRLRAEAEELLGIDK
ncbi:MAG: tetratricopeptide repeat protein, partial [Planctomycetota bacterium]